LPITILSYSLILRVSQRHSLASSVVIDDITN